MDGRFEEEGVRLQEVNTEQTKAVLRTKETAAADARATEPE
uniref:Uncharacterized protein n=1 Tax=Arundo donax TaxID=35708 RepID=A0A0A9G7U1_ARUDO